MIVPSMNSEEIAKEILKDYQMVWRKANYLSESLRREAIKSKNKYAHRIFNHRSNKKNDWLIFVDYYINNPLILVAIYYLNDFGFNAIVVQADNKTLIHYSSHFLDRYNERFLKQDKISKLDLLKRFLSQNGISTFDTVPNTDDYKNGFFGRFKEGIGLGIMEQLPNSIIYLLKTYISPDMIFERQKYGYDSITEGFKEHWDEFYKNILKDTF